MTLTPNLIACLAIGGAGILTALLSIPFFQHTGMLRRKCSARTTGTVVRYRLQRRGSGCGTSIAPVVEFQAAGETYTAYRHYKGIAVSKKLSPFQTALPEKPALLSGTTFSTYSRPERFTVWKLLPENCGDWAAHCR
ncbi:MAG: hypothetical protein ACLR1R_07755 [Ruminococcus callidus]